MPSEIEYLAGKLLTELDLEIASQVNEGNYDPRIEISLPYLCEKLRCNDYTKVLEAFKLLLERNFVVILDPVMESIDEVLKYLKEGNELSIRTRLGEFLYYLWHLRQRFERGRGSSLTDARPLIDDVRVLVRRRFYALPDESAIEKIVSVLEEEIDKTLNSLDGIQSNALTLTHIPLIIRRFLEILQKDVNITLTSFQVEALNACIRKLFETIRGNSKNVVTVTAPTGVGKTEIFLLVSLIAVLLAQVLKVPRPTVVILYPRRALVIDQIKRVCEYTRLLNEAINEVMREEGIPLCLNGITVSIDYGEVPTLSDLVCRDSDTCLIRILEEVVLKLRKALYEAIDNRNIKIFESQASNICKNDAPKALRHVCEDLALLLRTALLNRDEFQGCIEVPFGTNRLFRRAVVCVRSQHGRKPEIYVGFKHILCGCRNALFEYAVTDLDTMLDSLKKITQETPSHRIAELLNLRCICNDSCIPYYHVFVVKPSKDSYGDIHVTHIYMLLREIAYDQDPYTIDPLGSSELRFIRENRFQVFVFDEPHLYVGLFGSRTSELIRILQTYFVEKILIILSSATIPDAKEFSIRFTGIDDVTIVDYEEFVQRNRDRVIESGADYIVLVYNSLRERVTTAAVGIQLAMLIHASWLEPNQRMLIFVDEYDALTRFWKRSFGTHKFLKFLAKHRGNVKEIEKIKTYGGELPALTRPIIECKCEDGIVLYGLQALRVPPICTTTFINKWFKNVTKDCSKCIKMLGPDTECPLYRYGECWWIASKIGKTCLEPPSGFMYSARQRRGFSMNGFVDVNSAEIVVTTSALEVGVNYRNVRAIYQHGLPPRTPLISIVQRIGRSGREAFIDPLVRTLIVIGLNAFNPFHTAYYYALTTSKRLSSDFREVMMIFKERIAFDICNPKALSDVLSFFYIRHRIHTRRRIKKSAKTS